MFTIDGIGNISNILDEGFKKQRDAVIETAEELIISALEKRKNTIDESGLELALALLKALRNDPKYK